MKIEEVNEQWAVDCIIDRNNLQEETLRTPKLHQKYLDMLMACKSRLIKYHADMSALRECKVRYYNGEMSVDELEERGWRQYQGLKPLKSAMGEKLDGDQDVLKLRLRIEYYEALVYQLENILRQIHGRDWAIRNHLQFITFAAGG